MSKTSSKLRLVRCPKCQNLLPELPDYSVYQCGGCGAVLRAKKVTTIDESNDLKRDDEERIGVVCDKSNSLLGKSKDAVEDEEVRLSGNEGISESEKFSGESGKFVGKGIENGVKRVSDVEVVAQKFGNDLTRGVSKWVVEDVNLGENDVSNGDGESKVDKFEPHVEYPNVSRRSGRLFEQKMSDRGDKEQFERIRRGVDRLRFSNLSQVGEGSSKYEFDSKYRGETSRGTKPEYKHPDREELLRKLDELKEQLSRVQNVNENPREKSPIEHRMAHADPYAEAGDYFRNRTSSFDRISRQFSGSNKHHPGPPYLEPYCGLYPVMNRLDTDKYNYHGSMTSSNHVPRYEDSFDTHMLRRPPPLRIPSHHQYVNLEPECVDPHTYNMSLHHLSCSCYQCYDRQIPSSGFGNRGFGVPYHHELHPAFGPHGYNPRVVNAPPISSCEPAPRPKWPTELNPEMGSFSHARPRPRPQRVVLTNGHRYHPIAGGAPFVTCQNCFELLKLPKTVWYKKREWKMSCGSCSSLISFAFEDEKLVSIDTSLKQATTEAVPTSKDTVRGNVKRDNTSFCSEDYANSVYDFQAMDQEPVSSSTGRGVSLSKSATTSEDEHFSEELVDGQGVTSIAEPLENGASSPSPSPSPPGSPLQDPVDYGSKFHAVNRYGKGNLSSRSDQERVITGKNTMRQNSLKESLATEMDISLNDYSNNGVSRDTGDNICREEQPKGKKGGESFLAGIIKKSFRDFSRSNQTLDGGKRNVTINGHLVPDRLVKKAEKVAGPIYPGQYWYDYRAGFWGVMGGPCLGIIPPYVEEFNYPIPENCAGGNTGVFVNGRELHQKDLELLSTRGLPPARGRSYIIEITGRVVDEDTGDELDSLGKLAPTVEKVKHGFGMRPPKAPS